MSDQPTNRSTDDDTSPLSASTPEQGATEEGDLMDVAAERIYPTDPTGADPS